MRLNRVEIAHEEGSLDTAHGPEKYHANGDRAKKKTYARMDSISRASATTILGMAANTTIDAPAVQYAHRQNRQTDCDDSDYCRDQSDQSHLPHFEASTPPRN